MSDEINHDRRRFVGAAATTVAAAQFGVIAPAVANTRASKKVVRDVNGRSQAAGMDATVVLVHGAWADGSSWAHVITLLQSEGLKTMAAPIPLTSLSDDVAALERALERTDGPVVLVAHAYAGAVIGAITQDRVRSLVFISALSPDEGETVAQIFYRDKPRRRRRNSPPTVMVSSGCRTTGLARPGASMPDPSRLRSLLRSSVPLPSRQSRKRLRKRHGRQSRRGTWSPRRIE